MKKYIFFLMGVIVTALMSCASSKGTTTVSNGHDIAQYKYVVFGSNDEGDAELADILMMVQNGISEKLQVVSPEKPKSLILMDEKVVSPKINVNREMGRWSYLYIH